MRDPASTPVTRKPLCVSGATVALALLLAGCEGRFSADLATDVPADPGITQVQVGLLGLEFRSADGASTTLEFQAAQVVDLLTLTAGNPMSLFSSQQLPAGQYTGIRLLFDQGTDATVTGTGGQFPIVITDGDFATVDFTFTDKQSNDESDTLALDLRQSLSFDDVNDQYTLTPRVRAVRTGDAAQITGTVSTTCPAGTSLAQGGAVYVFAGADVLPDDVDGASAEPYATTRVVLDQNTVQFRYTVRFLPPGDYTLAPTCRGNEDDPVADDDLEFGTAQNGTVAAGDTLQLNLT